MTRGQIEYGVGGGARIMAAFRIGGLRVATLDDGAFTEVLAAAQAGGADVYPTLYSLTDATDETHPMALADELARLGATDAGRQVAMLIGALRDDLMEALAAAAEG